MIRNLAAPSKKNTKAFLKALLDEFNGAAKFKNNYVLSEAEMAAKFHLVSFMVSVEHGTGKTFGEMMSTPEGQAVLDEYCGRPPRGVPGERWRRHTMEVREKMMEDTKVRDSEVRIIAEVQVLLDEVVEVRHQMHEPYKYWRAENESKLHADILNSQGLAADEEEG